MRFAWEAHAKCNFDSSFFYWVELMREDRLHQRQIAPSADPGQGYVGQSCWHCIAVQPHQQVLEVLALRFRYGPRVRWCEGISGHVSLAFFKMRYWIDKSSFSIRILDEKGVIMVGNQGCLLTVHHPASLISILGYHYLHSTVWKDLGSISNRSTGHLGQGFLAREELVDDHLVHSLRCCPGDRHYHCIWRVAVSLVDFFICHNT